MPIPLEDILSDLSEADRAKVEAGAKRILDEEAATQEASDADSP